MAAARWFGSIIIVMLIAVGLFAGLYWFFPGQYQRLFSSDQQEVPEQVLRSVESLEQSLKDAGLSREEIQRVMDQVDLSVLQDITEEGIRRGVETSGEFFDLMRQRIDFSHTDIDSVRRAFQQRTQDIDFSEALEQLGRMAEQGLESLSEMIRSGTTR